MSATAVPLVRADAYLLAALTESGGRKALRLRDLIADYDWLERGIPTYDEASFGLRRLADCEYMRVAVSDAGEMLVVATSRALALRAGIRASTLGGVLGATAAAVGAAPYPEPEVEDRRLGRLAGLDAPMWDMEVEAYHAAFARDLGTLVAVPAVIGLAVGIGASVIACRRRRGTSQAGARSPVARPDAGLAAPGHRLSRRGPSRRCAR